MILFLAGSVFGRIKDFYGAVEDLEKTLGIQADWILQTGDLGVWPDRKRADKAHRHHGGAGDFASLYLNNYPAPRPTLFVSGKHEDHLWLDLRIASRGMELCPRLNWLVNGYKTVIGTTDEQLSIVGLGKVFSPSVYEGSEEKALGKYTRSEVERACSQGPIDLLLTHEAPKGARLGMIQSEAEGINKICFATRPKLLVHGHYNFSKEYDTLHTKVPAISLANGEIIAMEYQAGRFTRII